MISNQKESNGRSHPRHSKIIRTELHKFVCQTSGFWSIRLKRTFKCCPKYFYQLYTIHGLRNGHSIPLVYALLPGQSEVNNRDMWTSLIASCSARNLQLQVSVIHIDFEKQCTQCYRKYFQLPLSSVVGFILDRCGIVCLTCPSDILK